MTSFMLLLTLVTTSVVINAMPPPNGNSHGKDKSNRNHVNDNQQTRGHNRIGNIHDSNEDSDGMEMGWMGIKMHENGPNDGNMGNPMKWETTNQYQGRSNGMLNNQYPGMFTDQNPGMMNNQYPRRSNGIFHHQYPGLLNNQYPEMMYNQYPGMPNNQYPGMPNNQYSGMPNNQYPGMMNNQYPGRSNGMFNNQYPGMPNSQYPGRSTGGFPHYPTYNGDLTNHGVGSRGNKWNELDTIPSESDWKTRGKRQLSSEDNSKDSKENSVENSSESPEDMNV